MGHTTWFAQLAAGLDHGPAPKSLGEETMVVSTVIFQAVSQCVIMWFSLHSLKEWPQPASISEKNGGQTWTQKSCSLTVSPVIGRDFFLIPKAICGLTEHELLIHLPNMSF